MAERPKGLGTVSDGETDVPRSVRIWQTSRMPSGRIIIGRRADRKGP